MYIDESVLGDPTSEFEASLRASPLMQEALIRLVACDLPNYVLGAGVVAQSVWNARHGFDAWHGIADIDVVYFDPDTSQSSEARASARVATLLAGLGLGVDVKNQARVHLWYRNRFGTSIRSYTSLEDALLSWPTTATAVGVRLERERTHIVAPFGLRDLMSLVVRPNRVQVPRSVYEEKAARWGNLWPHLRVLPWAAGIGIEGERIIDDWPPSSLSE